MAHNSPIMESKAHASNRPQAPQGGCPRQFASTARLFTEAGFAAIRSTRLGVVGLGGVGSWAAEALARSGVAAITLVDMDHVAESKSKPTGTGPTFHAWCCEGRCPEGPNT